MYSIRRDVQPESEVGERRSDEESSFGSDSGVSTNETSKSKRVIYEIVVWSQSYHNLILIYGIVI